MEKIPKVEDVVWKNLPMNRRIQNIELDTHTLEFLLIFCDCVQEWGRPASKPIKQTYLEEERKLFVLDKLLVDKTGCSVTLKSVQLSRSSTKFKQKDREFGRLEKSLKSSAGVKFEITLEDKAGVQKQYLIPGPS